MVNILLIDALLPPEGALHGALPADPLLLPERLVDRRLELARALRVDLGQRLRLADVPPEQADRGARQ